MSQIYARLKPFNGQSQKHKTIFFPQINFKFKEGKFVALPLNSGIKLSSFLLKQCQDGNPAYPLFEVKSEKEARSIVSQESEAERAKLEEVLIGKRSIDPVLNGSSTETELDDYEPDIQKSEQEELADFMSENGDKPEDDPWDNLKDALNVEPEKEKTEKVKETTEALLNKKEEVPVIENKPQPKKKAGRPLKKK